MNLTITKILWITFFGLIILAIIFRQLNNLEYALFIVFIALGFAILIIANTWHKHWED